MKTIHNIIDNYPVRKIVLSNSGPVFTCEVTLKTGQVIEGLGTSRESADDTAWCGCAITLRRCK